MSYIASFDYTDTNSYVFTYDLNKTTKYKETAVKSIVFNGITKNIDIPDIKIDVIIFFPYINGTTYGNRDNGTPGFTTLDYAADFTFNYTKTVTNITSTDSYDEFIAIIATECQVEFNKKVRTSIEKWWDRIMIPNPTPTPGPAPPSKPSVITYLNNILKTGLYSINFEQVKNGIKVTCNLPYEIAYGFPRDVVTTVSKVNFCYVTIESKNYIFQSTQANLLDLNYIYISNGFVTGAKNDSYPWINYINSFVALTPSIVQYITNTDRTSALVGLVNAQMTFVIDLWFVYKSQSKIIVATDLSLKTSVITLGSRTIEMVILDTIAYENQQQDILIYEPTPQNWKLAGGWPSTFTISFYDFKSQTGTALDILNFSSVQIEILVRDTDKLPAEHPKKAAIKKEFFFNLAKMLKNIPELEPEPELEDAD
jgi:hypothetical protein